MYQTRMIPLVSVLGFGTWSFLIKEQLYYWRSSGGGKIVAAYDSISGTPLETAYYSPGSKTATAYLDLKTDEWIVNETIEIVGTKPVVHSNGGFLGGVLDGVEDLVGGAYHIVRHPIQTAEGIGHIITHPLQTTKALGHAIKDRASAMWSGDEYAAGKTFTDIAAVLLTPEAELVEAEEVIYGLLTASEKSGPSVSPGREQLQGDMSLRRT